MTTSLKALVIAILSVPVSAATAAVPVRSGEHPTFSRLVFADGPGRSWTLDQSSPGRVVIVFSAGVPDLDLSRVFDFIPRIRIRDATMEGGKLTLALDCDCPVDVSQIPSGHIVLDVGDGEPLPPASSAPRASPRPVLPIILPLSDIAFASPAAQDDPIAMLDVEDPSIASPNQVRLRPLGPVPLVLDRGGSERRKAQRAPCDLEDVARDALLADPTEALARLDVQAAAILDGEDRLDLDAVRILAQGYLAVGWGAEAAQIAGMDSRGDETVAVVAAAFDEQTFPDGVRVDPGCGPATAAIALLNPVGTSDWARADTTELTRFLDRIDPVRFGILLPRLSNRLAGLGDEEILTGLYPDASLLASQASDGETLAAGTDATAILAAIALLDDSNGEDRPAAEPHLVNAIALRPSIPDGDLRRRLDASLSMALVLSRRPAESVAMVADGNADAEASLTLALDKLPAPAAAEFAVRLRPYLPRGTPVAIRAVEVFENFGLASAARSFSELPRETLPQAVQAEGPLADPWMARDLVAMSEVDPAEWTARHRVAEEILAQNATPVPETDLAAAGNALDRSRRMSALVAQLVSSDGSGVTGR